MIPSDLTERIHNMLQKMIVGETKAAVLCRELHQQDAKKFEDMLLHMILLDCNPQIHIITDTSPKTPTIFIDTLTGRRSENIYELI